MPRAAQGIRTPAVPLVPGAADAVGAGVADGVASVGARGDADGVGAAVGAADGWA